MSLFMGVSLSMVTKFMKTDTSVFIDQNIVLQFDNATED